MNPRNVLKKVIQFGKREFKEKKPLSLEILRVKSRTIFKRGLLPEVSIKQIQGAHFLVVADYKEFYRIYSFAADGTIMLGENIEINPKLLKSLKNGTVLEYKLPKEPPKLTIGDISTFYQTKFNQMQLLFKDLYALEIKYPLIISAERDFKDTNIRRFGARKEKNFLKIDVRHYKKPIFDVIFYRELLKSFLETSKIYSGIQEAILYDYIYLLIFTVLRGEQMEVLLKILEKTTPRVSTLGKISHFLKSSYTKKELTIFLRNIFNALSILKKYKIEMQLEEFTFLFSEFYESFGRMDYPSFSSKLNGKDEIIFLRNYYLKLFNQKFDILQNVERTQLSRFLKYTSLIIMFSILGEDFSFLNEFMANHPDFELEKPLEVLYDLFDYKVLDFIAFYGKSDNLDNIQKEIKELKLLLSEMFVKYLFKNLLELKINSQTYSNETFTWNAKQNQAIVLKIEIINPSDIVIKNTSLKINIKPKKRAEIELLNPSENDDIHSKKEWNYVIIPKMSGKTTISLELSFDNPFIGRERLSNKEKIVSINTSS